MVFVIITHDVFLSLVHRSALLPTHTYSVRRSLRMASIFLLWLTLIATFRTLQPRTIRRAVIGRVDVKQVLPMFKIGAPAVRALSAYASGAQIIPEDIA